MHGSILFFIVNFNDLTNQKLENRLKIPLFYKNYQLNFNFIFSRLIYFCSQVANRTVSATLRPPNSMGNFLTTKKILFHLIIEVKTREMKTKINKFCNFFVNLCTFQKIKNKNERFQNHKTNFFAYYTGFYHAHYQKMIETKKTSLTLVQPTVEKNCHLTNPGNKLPCMIYTYLYIDGTMRDQYYFEQVNIINLAHFL